FALAEAADLLAERDGLPGRYGAGDEVDALAEQIVARTAELVAARPLPHCPGTGDRALLHAQAGIDLDVGATAGARIPIGTEPPLYDHIATVAPMHRYFPSGVSDILQFDDTARRNPAAIVDVIRGAFTAGMREFTFNLEGNGFVRVTGYLVRASDLAAIDDGVRHLSTHLGAGSVAGVHCDQRATKRIESHERNPGPRR
ncbi:MAG TPA: glycyl radical enzyme domain-containing protein, partial [Acidimicrobiales bacterium]|nr:glycyl radical enzyme domain-containing protein [Acidimicrobiales bacterium]